MTSQELMKGKLLFAEPMIIGDLSFSKSVILLVDHSDQSGTVGFIMNKPLDLKLGDLLPELNSNMSIYNGGPVEQDNLYFVHNVPDLIPNSLRVDTSLYWSGDFEVVIDLIKNNQIDDRNIKFFLGYSGWQPEQLQDELNQKSWIVTPNEYYAGILHGQPESFWRKKMLELGGEYLLWSNAPDNPVLN
ncbi:MAG: YqgE/AlgH family protein [Flavobacteriaceae bacterium]|nr:YqgE/AlgH family protein [Flavobacteriaceae bacterium]